MSLSLPQPPAWHEAAACASHDRPDLWFPSVGDRHITEAKAICRTCPVAIQCLASAIEHDEWGVWAATTDDERRAAQGKGRKHG